MTKKRTVTFAGFLGLSFLALANCEKLKSRTMTEKYVNIWSGLNLRSAPNATAAVLVTIPFGEKISQGKCQDDWVKIGRRSGQWCEATFKDLKGWLFSGLISSKPAIIEKKRIEQIQGLYAKEDRWKLAMQIATEARKPKITAYDPKIKGLFCSISYKGGNDVRMTCGEDASSPNVYLENRTALGIDRFMIRNPEGQPSYYICSLEFADFVEDMNLGLSETYMSCEKSGI